MRIDDIYNFRAELDRLIDIHDDRRPAVRLTGARGAGKTRVLHEVVATLVPNAFVVHLDCRDAITAADIASRALDSALTTELVAVRAEAHSTQSAVVIAHSTLTNATIRVRMGRIPVLSRFRRHRASPQIAPVAHSALPVLVGDLQRVERASWIVIDHAEAASDELLQFVQSLVRRILRGWSVRIVYSHVVAESAGQLESRMDAILRPLVALSIELPRLTTPDVRTWASALGLNMDNTNAELLLTLSDGRHGRLWEHLARLCVDPRWGMSPSQAGGR